MKPEKHENHQKSRYDTRLSVIQDESMRTVNSDAKGIQLRAETKINGKKVKMLSLKKVVVNLKDLVPEHLNQDVKVEINAKIFQHFNLLLDGIMKALNTDFTKCP